MRDTWDTVEIKYVIEDPKMDGVVGQDFRRSKYLVGLFSGGDDNRCREEKKNYNFKRIHIYIYLYIYMCMYVRMYVFGAILSGISSFQF